MLHIKHPRVLALLIVACLVTVVNAATVTFDATVDKSESSTGGENSIEKSGVTMHTNYGILGNGYQYRFYKTSTLTFTSTVGNITQIVITAESGEAYQITNLVAQSGSYDVNGLTGTWLGSAESVQFVASNAQARATKVEVTTAEQGGLAAPTLTEPFTFWPKMDKQPSASVTITPPANCNARYTTDGTNPSLTTGTLITSATTIHISGTTAVKAVSVSGNNVSSIAGAIYTLGKTVNGIAAFKALSNNEEARLFLSDESNARVLFVNDNKSQVFVRDNSGAICFYNVGSIPEFKVNQHIAGWIVGKYTTYGYLPEFVGTANTCTDELVVADMVTEYYPVPKEITVNDYTSNYADLVTIKELSVNHVDASTVMAGDSSSQDSLVVYNRFNINEAQGYVTPYNNAYVDMTGLAIPYYAKHQICPVAVNIYPPVTYVIDLVKDFTAPESGTTVRNTSVRLKRVFDEGNYHSLVLPFKLSDIDGTMYEFSDASDGKMFFTEVDSTLAGKPYIFVPNFSRTAWAFEGVDIEGGLPTTVTHGNYSFSPNYTAGTAVSAANNTQYINTDASLSDGTTYTTQAYVGWTVAPTIPELVFGAPSVYGDVNGDGEVTVGDVSAIYSIILGLSEDYRDRADVNGDGEVTVGDVSAIYNIILGLN